MKRLVLLGATGSIGTQTVDIVLQHPDQFSICALSAGYNIAKLKTILAEIHAGTVCVAKESDAVSLREEYPDIHFVSGDEGQSYLASECDYDVLVNALVGFVGFLPTLKAIESGHDVALANKETLVCGGALIKRALEKHGRVLYPIDSEHSAIFQCLQGNRKDQLKRLIITASGGSFRNRSREELKDVTVAEALAHPNWSMGAKITIDSATMMNKGFEVTEAHWLFDVDYDHIDVIMHPESVVHSMVEYVDHSVIAQLGAPDMRLPIQYALTWPDRLYYQLDKPLDLASLQALHFSDPDFERFPLLALAYEAGRKGGNLGAVMNAANEAANQAFRDGKIPFLMIEEIVIEAVHTCTFRELETVQDLIDADTWGREFAMAKIRSCQS
ncbi:MAG: 1-deoxy-D-xylulose-5-phosphate reductoisomerase [Solobacterium sp.]|nr:1-deoxy-D-xylulose-5-phosphate reductoisomerase [Solobacterium sp.]